tara:strand:- start:428 stop:1558 length:1131 start_codon:yes stop_codon:yes gene_type:complete
MTTQTNLNRAFIESNDRSTLSHYPFKEFKKNKIKNKRFIEGKFNIFKNSNVFLNIVPGFRFLNKDIEIINNSNIVNISSNEFDHVNDLNNTEIYPFFDNTEEKENKRVSYIVSNEVNKSYGSISDNNIEFKNKVYHDNGIKLSNVTNNEGVLISTLLSQDEDEFKESFIINDRFTEYDGSYIDVLGTIEEIKRSSVLDFKIKGISAQLVDNGIDVRNRSNNIECKINILDTNVIESYKEHGSFYHVYDSTQRYENFDYEQFEYNGRSIWRENFSSVTTIRETFSNELIFLSEDNNKFSPFNDYSYELNNNTLLVNNERYTLSGELDSHYKNKENSYNMLANNEDYIDGYLYCTVGHNIDYSQSIGIDSISYIGVLD